MNEPAAQTEASRSPVRKVVAATGGAGVGVVASNLVVGLLDDLVYTQGSVPDYLSQFLVVVVPMVVAGAAGYFVRRAPGE